MEMDNMNDLISPEYTATEEPRLIELQAISYIAIEGMGAPDGEQFTRRLAALKEVYQALCEKLESAGNDIERSYLEAQWWGVSGPGDFSSDPSSDWAWKLMYRVPDLLDFSETELFNIAEGNIKKETAKLNVIIKAAIEQIQEAGRREKVDQCRRHAGAGLVDRRKCHIGRCL